MDLTRDKSRILKRIMNNLSKMFSHSVEMPPFVNSQFFIMQNVRRIENVRIQILILNTFRMYEKNSNIERIFYGCVLCFFH